MTDGIWSYIGLACAIIVFLAVAYVAYDWKKKGSP